MPVGTFGESGGASGHSYSFTLAGVGSGAFTLASGTGPLSTAAAGVPGPLSGASVQALTVQVTDTTTGLTSNPLPFDVVVGSASGDTVNLAAGTGNLGIHPTTPTLVYGLGGNDTISATGLTGPVWLVGGPGGDTMTGGSGPNTYLYGATSESTPGAGNFDIITNFNVTLDKLDLTGIGGPPLSFQTAQLAAATNIPVDTIAWQRSGGNTFVYANTSASPEAVGGANMMIELAGSLTLTSANVLHN